VEETLGGQEAPPPLPCSATVARQGTVYDLHAAHQRSSSTDKAAQGFLPPRWRAFDPQLPQVPHTFPPRCAASCCLPGMFTTFGLAPAALLNRSPCPCHLFWWCKQVGVSTCMR
jgi:hypothetical protein